MWVECGGGYVCGGVCGWVVVGGGESSLHVCKMHLRV